MINKRYVYNVKECQNCGGWGKYVEVIRNLEESFLRRPKTWICPKCNGTGEEKESGEMPSKIS